jgi:hypothetical protein
MLPSHRCGNLRCSKRKTGLERSRRMMMEGGNVLKRGEEV